MPGYSAKCSLSRPLPGLCMAEAASAGPLLLRRRLQPRDYRSSAAAGAQQLGRAVRSGPPSVMSVATHTRKYPPICTAAGISVSIR